MKLENKYENSNIEYFVFNGKIDKIILVSVTNFS